MAKRKRYKLTPSTLIIIIILTIFSLVVNKPDNNTNSNNQQDSTGLTTGKQRVNTGSEYQDLAKLEYSNEQELIINNNDPNFSNQDLSTTNGSWQEYGDLDSLGRATIANALLNKDLMPTEKRKRLTVDPTGYQHKRVNNDWLYNRSHLIGFQLTGQNNNLENLMTGTRSLNSPGMNHYEMDIAYFLKNNPDKYIRYQVRPIYRGNELVARGVQMKAQSIGSDAIKFNVYIFNIEDNVKIDYSNGNSQIIQ
ncbi:hypothetical protein RD055328_08840 [Companilactobacillus sp. RD055328]|uniref:DNA/RNA non-specific endonuclease n=1 Tax=Companilactobacillus sp. RD055328 TaxID=2916634 RepID=UPI001FC7E31B|nr:DNA/RNA non-specific endonuclease [Companilactobacillus sp. RD055328]GKQ42961.1 hypothetical protein RD055328_08840 [Companilactobacillus sp. RD055328]